MTKLETVRALNDSGPQLQIVESVRTLQQSVSLMHEDLQKLPNEISSQTAKSLEPLDQIQQMHEDLQKLPEAIASMTASSLEPLDQMAKALDKGMDTQLAIIQPLIDAAVSSIQEKIEGLARDKVKRSVAMAREQHRKALQANRAAEGWKKEAMTSRKKKADMQAQIQNLKKWLWSVSGAAAALFLALVLVMAVRS